MDGMNIRNGFLKRDGRSLSHWLQTVQGDTLLNHRTTDGLPPGADIVIIGSGMTGTLVAKHCLSTWPSKTIVILEANEFCSGATGRNAGHCKPDQWRGFCKYEKKFGAEQALKILENEQRTWMELVKYVQDNKVDCELWIGNTLDIPMTSEVASAKRSEFEKFKAAGGRVDRIDITHDPSEAAKISRIKDAQACYAWPASTLHPWKLTAHIMRDILSKGVNLQTHTRAECVRQSQTDQRRWTVITNRGNIECSQVVHATNAYSSALEPSLAGLIRAMPHICTKATPPIAFSGSARLQNSYAVLCPDEDLITINPRSNTDGVVLFGGSNAGQERFEKWVNERHERSSDDSLTGYESITEAVNDFTGVQFTDWKDVPTESWSGIIGLSADGVPYIGQIPGLPGQWICAGHHGHGMARIFTAAPGLVKLMNGCSWADTRLPDVYEITASRVERLRQRSEKETRPTIL